MMIALGNGEITKAAIYDLYKDLNEALNILSGLQQGEPDLKKAERAKHTYNWLVNKIMSQLLSDDKMIADREEYRTLLKDQRLLGALQGAGVDNWEGYGIAMEAF